MAFTSGQVVNAADLNDLDINTLTTSGTVTIGGFSLPAVDGTADQVLVTNGSGTVTWQDAAGGSPGGSDGQIQYNNGGAFGGASGLTYNDSTGVVVASTGIDAGYVGKSITGAYTYITAWPNDGQWIAVNGGNGYLLLDGNYADSSIYLRSYNSGGNVYIGSGHSNTLSVGNGSITVNGSATMTDAVYTSNWFRTYGEEGLYSQSYGQHFYPDSGGVFWDCDGPIRIRDGYEGGIQGYLGYHDANGFGLLHSGGSWWLNSYYNYKHLVIGGSQANNAYNGQPGIRLMFGGGDGDAQSNYYIGTNLENYGGNYTKLDLRWHTGIRIGAQGAYGGVRFFNDEDFTTQIFHILNGRNYSNQMFRAEQNGNSIYWYDQALQTYGNSQRAGVGMQGDNSNNSTVQLRPSGGYLYVRSWNDGTGVIMRAASYQNYSTMRDKQDVTDWGASKSVGAAVDPAYAIDATEMVRNLRPVKFRRTKHHRLSADIQNRSERRGLALNRLNDYRRSKGMDDFVSDETVHQCGRDCDGTEENPCKLYRDWDKGEVGFIAEEVINVNPDAVWTDEEEQPITIDPMAMVTMCVKALQEIDARLAQLEAS